MKIETPKTPPMARNTYSKLLTDLKPGQVLRIQTAQEYRAISGNMARTAKQLDVKFVSMNDGDSDVLVFIRQKIP